MNILAPYGIPIFRQQCIIHIYILFLFIFQVVRNKFIKGGDVGKKQILQMTPTQMKIG